MKPSRNAKHIAPGATHGFIGQTKSKPKPKAKFEESPFITELRRKRDMVLLNDMFVCDETKEVLRERYKL